MKLQLSGFATIANSSKLSEEQKKAILVAPEGKQKAVLVKLVDPKGNEITLRAPLGYSKSKGSLTGRFSMKLEGFELVEVDKVDKDEKKKGGTGQSSVDDLIAHLLPGAAK